MGAARLLRHRQPRRQGGHRQAIRLVQRQPGHPASLPRVEAAKKYVEYMGGADAIVQNAKADYDKGNYRWVMQALMQVVYADPSNMAARNLMADASEQLGYQSEAGTWRGWYRAPPRTYARASNRCRS